MLSQICDGISINSPPVASILSWMLAASISVFISTKASRADAHRDQPVIVHDQRPVLAEVTVDARALAEVLGDAFIGVIAHAVVEADRLLRHHPQPVLEAGKRKTDLGVDVDRAIDVSAAFQHAAVQGEARPVDAGDFSSRSSFMSTLRRFEAVTSVHSNSCCFIRNLVGSPGTRIEQ